MQHPAFPGWCGAQAIPEGLSRSYFQRLLDVAQGSWDMGSTWNMNGWNMVGILSKSFQWNMNPPLPMKFWWMVAFCGWGSKLTSPYGTAFQLKLQWPLGFRGRGWSCGIPRPWLTLVAQALPFAHWSPLKWHIQPYSDRNRAKEEVIKLNARFICSLGGLGSYQKNMKNRWVGKFMIWCSPLRQILINYHNSGKYLVLSNCLL